MENWINKEPIQKGWSGDQKYCVTDRHGQKYLLRISPGRPKKAAIRPNAASRNNRNSHVPPHRVPGKYGRRLHGSNLD